MRTKTIHPNNPAKDASLPNVYYRLSNSKKNKSSDKPKFIRHERRLTVIDVVIGRLSDVDPIIVINELNRHERSFKTMRRDPYSFFYPPCDKYLTVQVTLRWPGATRTETRLVTPAYRADWGRASWLPVISQCIDNANWAMTKAVKTKLRVKRYGRRAHDYAGGPLRRGAQVF